jgi:hypothetical protein
MRPFDWQRDLHPSMTWIRGTVHREGFSPWWTPDRMELAVSLFCIFFAALLGYALGAR